MKPYIRYAALVLAAAWGLCLIPGCTDPDCLLPPTQDVTAPGIRLAVIYGPTAGAALDTLVVVQADTALYVDARADERLRVRFMAHDPEGLRSLQLGAAELTTVGVGLDSRRIATEPVYTVCPKAELSASWIGPSIDPGTSVTLAVAAENWAGLRSTTATVTLRVR